MSYATLAQLTDRYGERMLLQLSDRSTPPSGVIDTSVVDRALANTDAMIDGYLAGRYVLPLAETPPLLSGLAQEIAIYKLHPFQPDPKIEQEYKDALSQLDKISKGTIRLPLATIGEPVVTGADGVVAIDRERDFTPENMTGFI
jgi:phage gp36-like protein